jgi:hypothetical protein
MKELRHDLRILRFRRRNRQHLAPLGAAEIRFQAQESRRAKPASHPPPKSLTRLRRERVNLEGENPRSLRRGFFSTPSGAPNI